MHLLLPLFCRYDADLAQRVHRAVKVGGPTPSFSAEPRLASALALALNLPTHANRTDREFAPSIPANTVGETLRLALGGRVETAGDHHQLALKASAEIGGHSNQLALSEPANIAGHKSASSHSVTSLPRHTRDLAQDLDINVILSRRPHPTNFGNRPLRSRDQQQMSIDVNMSPPRDTKHEDVEGVDLAVFEAYEAFFDDVMQYDYIVPGDQSGASRAENHDSTEPSTPEKEPMRKVSITRHIPDRLTSHIPPANFGAVLPGAIYRSSFPYPENFSFMKSLRLKTILTLVPEPYPQPFITFMEEQGIKHVRIHVPANKEVVRIETSTMIKALGVVLDRSNHPMLIHCNKGKHRTGCVTACFRKVTGVSASFVSHEYHTYAGAKARKLDEEFIGAFDERALLWLARENDFLPKDEPSADSPGAITLLTSKMES